MCFATRTTADAEQLRDRLSDLTQLTHLTLSEVRVKCVQNLLYCLRVQLLPEDATDAYLQAVDNALQAVRGSCALGSMVPVVCCIDPQHPIVFAALPNLVHLRNINLEQCCMNDQAVGHVCMAVRCMSSLQELSLSVCKAGSNTLELLSVLSEATAHLSSLALTADRPSHIAEAVEQRLSNLLALQCLSLQGLCVRD